MAFTLRTDQELEEALDALSAEMGISKQEAARRSILETAERRGHAAQFRESNSRMLERWGDVLDRLADA
jgi:predicted transcriptional regulator